VKAVKDFCAVTLGINKRSLLMQGVLVKQIDLESIYNFSCSLEEIAPHVVIHAAGLTSVERCELDPDYARHVNVTLSVNVAKACSMAGVDLIYISTDHLFSGRDKFVDEEYPTSPVNVYAKTKAEAECRILEINSDSSLVIRTNFYGWGPSYRESFSDFIINNIRAGSSVTLFQDVFFTPLLAETLALLVHELIRVKAKGIFNIVGDSRISKYDFGIAIADQFQLDSSKISPGLLANHNLSPKRPLEMSLSNVKLKNLLGLPVGGIKEQISKLHQQELNRLGQGIQNL
jgi:dTDP-4-dehydrorhamnose reductase